MNALMVNNSSSSKFLMKNYYSNVIVFLLLSILICNFIGAESLVNTGGRQLTSLEVDKFFDFVNQMANSQDKEVQNIFVVEVLEIFSDRAETIKIAREKLNDNGRQMLEKTLKGWK